MGELVLVINPGSTSTKFALYSGEECLLTENVSHPIQELQKYDSITDQEEFRRQTILRALEKQGYSLEDLDCVSARGGLLKPIPGGTWLVNEAMVADLKAGLLGEHASNLGGVLAHAITSEYGCLSYIVDPVIVDEMEDIARLSGMPEIPRRSIFHALNQKAVAREVAEENGKRYHEQTYIVAHMGGGVSIGLHHVGRVIDVNNALDGEGPFSPERSGGVPVGDLVKLCFSGTYTLDAIKGKIKGRGGLFAYLGTADLMEIEDRIDQGDTKAKEVFEAMAYQIAKEIGSLATVVHGALDGIILTGGMARSIPLVQSITRRISFIAPLYTKPGEREMEALAQGALRVLRGEEEPNIYQ